MSTPAPSSHLPGRLTSLSDVLRVEGTLKEIDDLIVRLKVQAFVIVIHDLFESSSGMEELSVLGDDGDRPLFTAFQADDDDSEEAVREATQQIERLAIPSDCFTSFETQQPFTRDGLEDQLAAAYEGALTPSQRQRGGVWASFWSALRAGRQMF